MRIPSKAQMTGMRGVYLVAAELSRLGFIVSATSRSACGADLLVTDQRCRRAYSVQVKTNARTFNFWLIGRKAKDTVSDTHIYVPVNIKETRMHGLQLEYFVVPRIRRIGPTPAEIESSTTRDAWEVFGNPV